MLTPNEWQNMFCNTTKWMEYFIMPPQFHETIHFANLCNINATVLMNQLSDLLDINSLIQKVCVMNIL